MTKICEILCSQQASQHETKLRVELNNCKHLRLNHRNRNDHEKELLVKL